MDEGIYQTRDSIAEVFRRITTLDFADRRNEANRCPERKQNDAGPVERGPLLAVHLPENLDAP